MSQHFIVNMQKYIPYITPNSVRDDMVINFIEEVFDELFRVGFIWSAGADYDSSGVGADWVSLPSAEVLLRQGRNVRQDLIDLYDVIDEDFYNFWVGLNGWSVYTKHQLTGAKSFIYLFEGDYRLLTYNNEHGVHDVKNGSK